MSELIRPSPPEDRQLSAVLPQLTALVDALTRRLAEDEGLNSRLVSITHRQYKDLAAAIRDRAAELAERYHVPAAPVRAAIKRGALREFAVEELHDLPLRLLDVALMYIRQWQSYTTIARIREKEAQRDAG